MTGGGPIEVAILRLPGSPCSVARAREFVRAAVPRAAPAWDDLVTVVSETVGNAVTHTRSGAEGGRVIVILVARDGGYRLEVADDGAEGARPYVATDDAGESGRGMRIVDALASRWGFREIGHRTVVWAEFADQQAAPAAPRIGSA